MSVKGSWILLGRAPTVKLSYFNSNVGFTSHSCVPMRSY